MAIWTTPKTWVVGDVLTAADMNVYVRDNTTYLHDGASQILYDSGSLGVAAASISSGTLTPPSGAKQLRFILRGRSDQAGSSVTNGPIVRFNGDSVSTYRLFTVNAGGGSNLTTGFNLGNNNEFANSNSPANYWAHVVALVPLAFDTDVEKEVQFHMTSTYDATPNGVADQGFYGHWPSTAAVNAISVTALVGNLVAKSRLLVYADA